MTHDAPAPPRPWYCNEELVETYKQMEQNGGGPLNMPVKAWKILKAIITNTVLGSIAVLAILEGGDPTVVGTTALVALALVNGVEVSEWLAAKQAIEELKAENQD